MQIYSAKALRVYQKAYRLSLSSASNGLPKKNML